VLYAQRQRAMNSHAASRGGIGRLTDLVKGVFKEFL
jgi:hypothetical protein